MNTNKPSWDEFMILTGTSKAYRKNFNVYLIGSCILGKRVDLLVRSFPMLRRRALSMVSCLRRLGINEYAYSNLPYRAQLQCSVRLHVRYVPVYIDS